MILKSSKMQSAIQSTVISKSTKVIQHKCQLYHTISYLVIYKVSQLLLTYHSDSSVVSALTMTSVVDLALSRTDELSPMSSLLDRRRLLPPWPKNLFNERSG